MISDDVRSILLILSVCALGHYIGKLVAEIINEREIKKEIERMKEERDRKHNIDRAINQVPTLDYAPVVHAHWEIIYPNELKQMQGNKCSSYGYEYYGNLHDYCSYCGAKMDEEVKE